MKKLGGKALDKIKDSIDRDPDGADAKRAKAEQDRKDANEKRKEADKARQETFMQTGDAFAADRAFHQEFTGFDSQGNFLGGAKGGSFYVGGVPTKPMKPQRLKKGGLAKPKVKPKRMKKGGLASKKK